MLELWELEETYNHVDGALYQGGWDAWKDEFWQDRKDVAFIDVAGDADVQLGYGYHAVPHVLMAIDDAQMPADVEKVRDVAKLTASLSDRMDTLVMCAAGWNRSGLIVARALMYRGVPVTEAIDLVRRARGRYALSNPWFVAWLREEGGLGAADTYLAERLRDKRGGLLGWVRNKGDLE